MRSAALSLNAAAAVASSEARSSMRQQLRTLGAAPHPHIHRHVLARSAGGLCCGGPASAALRAPRGWSSPPPLPAQSRQRCMAFDGFSAGQTCILNRPVLRRCRVRPVLRQQGRGGVSAGADGHRGGPPGGLGPPGRWCGRRPPPHACRRRRRQLLSAA